MLVSVFPDVVLSTLKQPFRLWTRDQHVGSYGKHMPREFGTAQGISQRQTMLTKPDSLLYSF